MQRTDPHSSRSGFTLIEISIVLVIVGLLVGGVLVGMDLITAARIRAQITQIEKYNQAVNTFQGKYNCLPGDCAQAALYGFKARGSSPGQGDGSGVITGTSGGGAEYRSQAGEPVLFWADLSQAGLIEGTFTAATAGALPTINGSALAAYLPQAKLGSSNYILVYADAGRGKNYYNLTSIPACCGFAFGTAIYPTPQIAVNIAYYIDQKVDDGYPATGKVTANFLRGCCNAGDGILWAPNATSPGNWTCFDSGGVVGGQQQYTMSVSGGSNAVCALSFQFQ